MNREVQLVHTGAVALKRFDHAPGVAHRDPERERSSGHGVNFVETGSFRVRTTGSWRELGTDALFVGRPPHRFLTDVRLAHAHARLREGASVTDTCFAVGFGSLSHFVTTFRRRYGARPSELRRSGRAAGQR